MLIPAYLVAKSLEDHHKSQQAAKSVDQIKKAAMNPDDPRHEQANRVLAEYRKNHPPERGEHQHDQHHDFGR